MDEGPIDNYEADERILDVNVVPFELEVPVTIICNKHSNDIYTTHTYLRDSIIAYYRKYDPSLRERIKEYLKSILNNISTSPKEDYDDGESIASSDDYCITSRIRFRYYINFGEYEKDKELDDKVDFNPINKVISIILPDYCDEDRLEEDEEVMKCVKIWVLTSVVEGLNEE
jgi:hypothetical protein